MGSLDCTKCGACCVGQLILLRSEDDVPPEMRDGDLMRKQLGDRCVALDGRVGIDVSCSIYERRPAMCRAIPAGCYACVNMRRDRGLHDG